ncbi:HGH1 protein, partial [Orthonyx spaldingii]|nr:HGH1 protein [Orthonyx spaldingii]
EQLAATKAGRARLRSRGCYVVLRELHAWESDPDALSACLNLIQVLIGDEPEEGMENLLEVEIPEDIQRRFRDRDLQEQREKEREKSQKEQEKSEKEREELEK